MTEEQESQNGLIAEDNNSWLHSLPDDLKAAESLKKFKDISALANSYLELEKSLNSRVVVPKEDATDEDWHKFYNRLGRPEDKRYTDNRVEEDEPYLSSYEEIFYNSGLNKRQGEKMLEGLYNLSNKLQKKQEEKIRKQEEEIQNLRNSNENELKSYYSDKGGLDSKIDFIKLALNKYAQPNTQSELANHVEKVHYNPALIKFLVNVGETLKSDSLITGTEKPRTLGAESALKEIKKLESDEDFMLKYKKGNEQAVSQMRQLHEIAYNNK